MTNISLKELLYKLVNRYPIGSCYTTSTNTNPGTWLGGTWELIHKKFKSQWIDTGFTFNTQNTQDGTFIAILDGTTIEFRLTWKNKIALSDSTTVIGTLDRAAVGIYFGAHAIYPIAFNDGCNAIGMMFFDLAGSGTGQLLAYDWVTRATSYPTTTGEGIWCSFTLNMRYTYMLDSFCDEFVWKRTA